MIEAASPLKWDHFVELVAMALQDDINVDGWELASDVFRPSPDEEVKALRNDPSGVPRQVIEKYAMQYGLDSDDLQDAFDKALDASEEYMTDEDEEEKEYSQEDVDAAQDWRSLDELANIEPVAASGFMDAFHQYMDKYGGFRPGIDDVEPGERYFAVGPRLIIFYDTPEDAAAAVMAFLRESGEWVDAGYVWDMLD